MNFLDHLRSSGLIDLVSQTTTYFQRVRMDEARESETRIGAGTTAGYIFEQTDRHPLAILEFEAVLTLSETFSEVAWRKALISLMRVCHYGGESLEGQEYGLQALHAHTKVNDPTNVAYINRFLAEIALHLDEAEQALQYCEVAARIRQEGGFEQDAIADALYWRAKALAKMGRWEDASATIEQVLALWQEISEATGVGFCLRLMGQIHCKEGRYAEAQAHLEYAILLHERTGGEANRFAAVEALGDIYEATKRYTEAQTLYNECLQYYTRQHKRLDVERLQAKAAMRL